MSTGKAGIQATDRTQGFDKNPQNINKKGRGPSLKRALREMLEQEGELVIEKKNVIAVNEDGSVRIKIPDEGLIILKLKQWLMSKNPTASMKAIQLAFDYIDGKPHQSLSIASDQPVITYEVTDDQVAEIVKELKPKKEDEST